MCYVQNRGCLDEDMKYGPLRAMTWVRPLLTIPLLEIEKKFGD